MDDVYRWALKAAPGERVVYHVGEKPPESHAAFKKAWNAHASGLVFLAQRRLRRGRLSGEFQYEATRISEHAARKLGLMAGSLSYTGVV